METIFTQLVDKFVNGRLTRRELIQSLAMAATAAGVGNAAAPADADLKSVAVNHISYNVKDYAKTRDFYAGLLGMKVSHDNGKSQCYLQFGDTFLISRNAAGGNAPGSVDHIAYSIERYDKNAVEAELKRRGLAPQPDTDLSWTVKDPDGVTVQIGTKDMRPGHPAFEKLMREMQTRQR